MGIYLNPHAYLCLGVIIPSSTNRRTSSKAKRPSARLQGHIYEYLGGGITEPAPNKDGIIKTLIRLKDLNTGETIKVQGYNKILGFSAQPCYISSLEGHQDIYISLIPIGGLCKIMRAPAHKMLRAMGYGAKYWLARRDLWELDTI